MFYLAIDSSIHLYDIFVVFGFFCLRTSSLPASVPQL